MPIDVADRPPVRLPRAATCPEHDLPLFPTLVGPRCPVCGAAATTSRRLAG